MEISGVIFFKIVTQHTQKTAIIQGKSILLNLSIKIQMVKNPRLESFLDRRNPILRVAWCLFFLVFVPYLFEQ